MSAPPSISRSPGVCAFELKRRQLEILLGAKVLAQESHPDLGLRHAYKFLNLVSKTKMPLAHERARKRREPVVYLDREAATKRETEDVRPAPMSAKPAACPAPKPAQLAAALAMKSRFVGRAP